MDDCCILFDMIYFISGEGKYFQIRREIILKGEITQEATV